MKARARIAKIGRVLSSANEKTLRQALDAIEQVLSKLGVAQPAMQPLSKADAQAGAMVALFPDPATAQGLAQPGGEPAGDLHVTLAFLGDAAEITDPQRLRTIVEAFAATCPPLIGEVSGSGRFTSGAEPVTWAAIDVPCLSEVRDDLCEDLCAAGFEASDLHGFTPHMTLAYDDRALSLPPTPLSFDTVTLAIGGQRQTFFLTGQAHDHSADAADDVFQMERTTPLWKDDAAQVVYGVVLQPGVYDSQGDIVSAAEIEQAAHRYLVHSRKSDVQHDEHEAPVDVVESYVAPMDMEVAGRTVLKGSWVMGVHVADLALWQKVVKREITGFSIGGTAIRA